LITGMDVYISNWSYSCSSCCCCWRHVRIGLSRLAAIQRVYCKITATWYTADEKLATRNIHEASKLAVNLANILP